MSDTDTRLDCLAAEGLDDLGCALHAPQFAKLLRNRQAKTSGLRCVNESRHVGDMTKPFEDIATRLKWHRNLVGLTQDEYAERLGVKRSRYSRWEAGNDRLSLDGAIALRRKYGLSLDFMYEGIDDALPMTLRNAWSESP